MSETTPKLHVILCEGFDDRSFWAGWLEYLGCGNPTNHGKKQRLEDTGAWDVVAALIGD